MLYAGYSLSDRLPTIRSAGPLGFYMERERVDLLGFHFASNASFPLAAAGRAPLDIATTGTGTTARRLNVGAWCRVSAMPFSTPLALLNIPHFPGRGPALSLPQRRNHGHEPDRPVVPHAPPQQAPSRFRAPLRAPGAARNRGLL